MATIPDAYVRRIQRDLPGTDHELLDYITDGMVNDVVVVDRTWVYRFAKHDWSKALMQHEAKVLDLVRAHVDITVPRLELLGDDCCRYAFLAGTPLTRRAVLGWSQAERDAVLRAVVRFVSQVHAIPAEQAAAAGIGPSDTNRDASWWRTFYADLTTTLYPHLMRHQRDYVEDLFAPVLDESSRSIIVRRWCTETWRATTFSSTQPSAASLPSSTSEPPASVTRPSTSRRCYTSSESRS